MDPRAPHHPQHEKARRHARKHRHKDQGARIHPGWFFVFGAVVVLAVVLVWLLSQ